MKNHILLIFVSLVLVMPVAAQGTEFTYQGKLNDGGVAANANYDFEFRLFNALAGGAQVGPLLTRPNVAVAAGIFSVKLDFGGFFPGADRFLEIRVRNAGGTSYTLLDPRQKIDSAPYGIKSLVAETANNANNLGGVAAADYLTTIAANLNYIRNTTSQQGASNFNISGNGTIGGNLTVNGTLTANLPAFDTSYVQNRSSAQPGTTNFNISGTGTANIFGATQFNGGNFTGALFAGSLFNSTNGFYQDNVRILNTPGTNNTFAGRQTGTVNTGADNSFFGFNAGNGNLAGINNSFFGSDAGGANSTGNDNSFFGSDTGDSNSTGFDNSFFGRSAGGGNTTGHSNSFFGRDAGLNNTTADGNSFFGRSAGFSNTTGGGNSFFGRLAGSGNTTGFDNSFFGENSGIANTGGSNNSFFGTRAGDANTSGTQNSFFGSNAGGASTTGGFNTFVGRNAGAVNTTGSNNTYIGFSADGSADITNATAIGANAQVTQSNSVVLGSGVEVGIGTSAPFEKLHVVGNIYIDNLPNEDSYLILRDSSDNSCYGVFVFDGSLEIAQFANCPSFRPNQENVASEPKEPRRKVVEQSRTKSLIEEQRKELADQRKLIVELKTLVCATNGTAAVCKEEDK